MLAQVGLSGINEKFPSELSGGMRKRVALARGADLGAGFLLFDEPTTGLDPYPGERHPSAYPRSPPSFALHGCHR